MANGWSHAKAATHIKKGIFPHHKGEDAHMCNSAVCAPPEASEESPSHCSTIPGQLTRCLSDVCVHRLVMVHMPYMRGRHGRFRTADFYRVKVALSP
jgi:hypothetical protein